MARKTKCSECGSKDLSDGKSDFIYDVFNGIERAIQFCNKCHDEWFIHELAKPSLSTGKSEEGRK